MGSSCFNRYQTNKIAAFEAKSSIFWPSIFPPSRQLITGDEKNELDLHKMVWFKDAIQIRWWEMIL